MRLIWVTTGSANALRSEHEMKDASHGTLRGLSLPVITCDCPSTNRANVLILLRESLRATPVEMPHGLVSGPNRRPSRGFKTRLERLAECGEPETKRSRRD